MGLTDKHMAYGDDIELGKKWSFYNEGYKNGKAGASFEPKKGHWIPHETPDGGKQYECSECGVLWEFNDGTPEDNEAYFCPKCGAKMKGVKV